LPSRVGEVGEHEERQPVRRALVESTQDARVVLVAGTALKQGLRLFTAILAEVLDQQVDHGPEVAALFHVHLEQVAHVVQRGGSGTQETLLLHRGGLGVALHHDQAAQQRAVFTRHFLPGGLALVAAAGDDPAFFLGRQQDAPAVFGHLHVAELGPAARVHPHGGAQVDLRLLEALGAHLLPPVDVVGLPGFERALQLLVAGQVDVVGDAVVVIDFDEGVAADGSGFFNQFSGFAHGVS
jgi:hypothetical protein